jgi:hypothetical protein
LVAGVSPGKAEDVACVYRKGMVSDPIHVNPEAEVEPTDNHKYTPGIISKDLRD